MKDKKIQQLGLSSAPSPSAFKTLSRALLSLLQHHFHHWARLKVEWSRGGGLLCQFGEW